MVFEDSVGLVKEELDAVEAALRKNFMSDVVMIPEISRYLSEGGGKRIRPLLLLTASKLCGYHNGDRPINISCVVEFIHSATLLHDDVVDEAHIRRGKASSNVKWGNEASVLVGDYLFSKSFQLVAQDNDFRILATISEASRRLIEGEVLQLTQRRSIFTTEKEYFDMVRRKTAALIASSCQAGAIIGKAPEETESALFRYGDQIGMAFQLIDDLLDYISEEEKLGKPARNDLREGHITLPLIRLLARAGEKEKKMIKGIVSSDEGIMDGAAKVLDLMEKYAVVEYTIEKAREFVREGKKEIAGLPPSIYLDSLFAIADYVVEKRVESCLKGASL
ncbi:MAG: polyprenyl synthetase family protein [Nitrospinae bacterium]|nr:polyprenyl synthetase family protein [Nitrospinota bacterium]